MTIEDTTRESRGLRAPREPRGKALGLETHSAGANRAFLHQVAMHDDRPAMARAIAEQLVARLSARRALVYAFACGERRLLRLLASRSVVEGHELELIDIDESSAPAARAARTRALQLVGNVLAPVPHLQERIKLAHPVTFALPLVAGNRLLGVVTTELTEPLAPEAIIDLESLGVVLGALMDRAQLAEQARARDEWMKVVAHEVRQPLSTMTLHARWLSKELQTATPDVASALGHIAEGVKRVNRLVADFVDAAHADLAEVDLQTREVDLVALAGGLAAPVDPSVPSRIRVVGSGPLRAEVDPERIEQVLANLLANAMKYGRRGSMVVLAVERSGEDEVELSVTNEGIDIPQEELDRLFELYYRGHQTSSDGWGIGLHVCHRFVEAHAGRILVESGGGTTTFRVILPIARGSQATRQFAEQTSLTVDRASGIMPRSHAR